MSIKTTKILKLKSCMKYLKYLQGKFNKFNNVDYFLVKMESLHFNPTTQHVKTMYTVHTKQITDSKRTIKLFSSNISTFFSIDVVI